MTIGPARQNLSMLTPEVGLGRTRLTIAMYIDPLTATGVAYPNEKFTSPMAHQSHGYDDCHLMTSPSVPCREAPV